MSSTPWIFICPSSRGIGLALTRRLLLKTSLPILATTRHPDPSVTKACLLDNLGPEPHHRSFGRDTDLSERLHVVRCDVTDEDSIRHAGRQAAELFPHQLYHLHLACAIPGILDPEKSPMQINQTSALQSFQTNTVGPLLLAKYFAEFLPRRVTEVATTGQSTISEELDHSPLPKHATWLSMAAGVGSTTNNDVGGWYSYRASKAGVVSTMQSLDPWLQARCGDKALAIAYDPGTVKTDLNRRFWATLSEDELFSPEYAAEKMVDVICGLTLEQRGKCWNWRGKQVAP